MKKQSINPLYSTPSAIFLGLIIIAVAILMNGGIIKIGKTTTTPAAGIPTAAAPTQPQPPTAPVAPAKVDVALGHFPIKGDPNAKISIIEFADFRCPFCERLFTTVVPSIMTNYVNTGKAKFAFRQYAFLGPASTVAANAAECANDQGKFWEMHDYFYKNQPDESDTTMYTTDKLTTIAGTLGINTDQFRTCLSTNKDSQNVTDDMTAGQQAGVNGTPATFINGKVISGACPITTFDSAIQAELNGKNWSVTNCVTTVQ